MAVNPDDPTLPVACADQAVPTLHADNCAPVRKYGPIVNLLFTKDPFAAPPTALEITRRMEITDAADPERITMLIGTMTQTAPTPEVDRINGRDYPKVSDRQFPIRSYDLHQQNVDFARLTEYAGWSGRVYGIDANNDWHGGQNGISGTVRLSVVLPEDENALQTIEGNLTARTFFSPKRIPSPIPAVFGSEQAA